MSALRVIEDQKDQRQNIRVQGLSRQILGEKAEGHEEKKGKQGVGHVE